MIHKTAIIESGAEIADDVQIGAYSVVSKDVKIASGVKIESHVVIGGNTEIGERTHIFPFASIGLAPQDLKFKGEKNSLIIGKKNIIREHVTMNPGTEGGGSVTRVGDNCLFMIGAHVAHDCIVGNHVILANNATLAGHVVVGDYAVIGGLSAIHQFVRIGHQAMIGGMSGIESDVIPYGSAMGERASLAGLNLTGMKRRNFSREEINDIRAAYKALFSDSGNIKERIAKVEAEFGGSKVVKEVIGFMKSESSRSLCLPKNE